MGGDRPGITSVLSDVWSGFKPHYLQAWARMVVRSCKPFVIGITGSVGKTTTKDMIAAVLTGPGREELAVPVGFTTKDMNNDVGVPLTILRFEEWPSAREVLLGAPLRAFRLAARRQPFPEVLVLEIAAGWHSHVHRLARLVPPDIAVVTAIGPAHLERFKTVDGVMREKVGLVQAVPPSGLVVLGEGHEYVAALAQASRARVVTVPGRGVDLSRNITRAVCQRLGVSEQAVESALRDFRPPKHRLNRIELIDITVIDDSYNANPLSMKLALDTLADAKVAGARSIAVLGGMAELGGQAQRYHEEIGAYARPRADVVVGVGSLAERYGPDHLFATSEACADWIPGFVRQGDCILVKGSHAVRASLVVDRLCRTASEGLERRSRVGEMKAEIRVAGQRFSTSARMLPLGSRKKAIHSSVPFLPNSPASSRWIIAGGWRKWTPRFWNERKARSRSSTRK